MRETVLRKGPELRRRMLVAVVFFTPLFFLRNAYDVFNVPKLSLVMFGVSVVAAIRIVEFLQGAERASVQLILVPAAAVAGAFAVGTVFSPYRVWALIGDHFRFTGLVPYLALILLGVLIADAFGGNAGVLAWALVTSGAVAGAYGIVQVLGLDPLEWSATEQATTTIGNTNFSGGFFAICLPVGVGLFMVEKERRPVVAGLSAVIAVGWLVARSEGAWAAGVAGLLVLAGALASGRWNPARLVGLGAAAAIAAAGVGFVLVAMTERPPASIPATIERRAEWWQASMRMAGESPLLGRGPNSFAIEHTHHRDIDDVVEVGSDVTDDPHSLPLSFLTGAGIFGVIAFLTLIGSIVLAVLRVRPDQVVGAGFAGAAIAYLVQSLITVDVISLRFAGWTALGGAAAALAPPLPVRSKRAFRKNKRKRDDVTAPLNALPAVAAVILVGVLGMFWSIGFLFADISFRRGLSPTSDGASAQADLRSAIAFRESNDTYRRHYGRLLGANATRQALEDGDHDAAAREFLEEAKQTFSFTEDFPHANSFLDYARVMRDWAQVDPSAESRALELYERAAELDPYNYRILDEAAAAASAFGREDLAQDLSERSAQLQQSADD